MDKNKIYNIILNYMFINDNDYEFKDNTVKEYLLLKNLVLNF